MPGLVSDAEMAGLQSLAEIGMADTCTILTQDNTAGGLEGDTDYEYTASLTVKCWLWETLGSDNAEVVGGVEAITTSYRLFLPVGTPIENGDRVVVKGETYIVVATNAENTYRPVLRVSLRRAE
jgi:hypothetical protein